MSGKERIANRKENVKDHAGIWLDIRGFLTAAMASPLWADEAARPDHQSQRADEIGLRLPTYRSPSQIAALEAATPQTVDDYINAMLSPDDAARDFLDWIRASGRSGRHTAEELDAIYGIHCQELNRIPTPENVLRKHLSRAPGVFRSKADVKRHGKRSRPTVWTIEETVSTRKAAA